MTFVRFVFQTPRTKAACVFECFAQLAVVIAGFRGFSHSQQESSIILL
jgi:hypothetical protein